MTLLQLCIRHHTSRSCSNDSCYVLSLLTAAFRVGAIDYTDLYYVPGEEGWGVNVVQSDDFLFLTFFIYGPDNKPTWYTAQLTLDASGNYNGSCTRRRERTMRCRGKPTDQTTIRGRHRVVSADERVYGEVDLRGDDTGAAGGNGHQVTAAPAAHQDHNRRDLCRRTIGRVFRLQQRRQQWSLHRFLQSRRQSVQQRFGHVHVQLSEPDVHLVRKPHAVRPAVYDTHHRLRLRPMA